jgi:dCMP deaminase
MDNAISIARLSKCISMQVGCIAVNERGRIISTGVNGTVSGYKNCCDVHSGRGVEHSSWSEKFEIHAEMNCILEMARSSVTFQSLDLYVTHCPCSNCLKHIIGLRDTSSGAFTMNIRNIIYNEVYYRTPIELLLEQKEYCKLFGVNLLSIDEVMKNNE